MCIFNPVQNPDERYDVVVLCIPELFGVTPTCTTRCWERRNEGIRDASVKDIQNKGIPSSGTFPERFFPVGKWSGLQWRIPSYPSWGPWVAVNLRHGKPVLWVPQSLGPLELSWSGFSDGGVGDIFFSSFKPSRYSLLLFSGVLVGTKPLQMENQTANESHTHPEP